MIEYTDDVPWDDEGTGETTMSDTFDWIRDCGGWITPAEAAQRAREAGQTYQQYAEEYLAAWPHAETPPADLVPGMAAAMEATDL